MDREAVAFAGRKNGFWGIKFYWKEFGLAKYFAGAIVLGFVCHFASFYAVFLLALIGINLVIRKLSGREITKTVIIGIIAFVFFIGTLGGDLVMPPTARCSDGTYSYSAHRSGTCSWHGGVGEWNPGPWWFPTSRE